MSTEREKGLYRWYVLKTTKGHAMLKVPFNRVGEFLSILGDLMVGCGDSREEALADWASRRLTDRKRGVFEWIR